MTAHNASEIRVGRPLDTHQDIRARDSRLGLEALELRTVAEAHQGRREVFNLLRVTGLLHVTGVLDAIVVLYGKGQRDDDRQAEQQVGRAAGSSSVQRSSTIV